MAFTVILPARLPLGPLTGLGLRRGRLRLMLRTARLLPLFQGFRRWASTPGVTPDAASLLPGSLATTWTGLSPAGEDELADTRDQIIEPTALPTDRACPLDTQ
jgi:hypothetical protein